MQEFIEKLIERLNKALPMYASGWRKDMNEIVNQLAEEYKEINIPTIDAGELLGNSEQVKKTNADRIRAMSDEELADYLYRMALCSLTTVKIDNKEIAIPKLLKWLQSEAE